MKDRRYNEIEKLIASLLQEPYDSKRVHKGMLPLMQEQSGAGLGTQSGTGLLDRAKEIASKIINWNPFKKPATVSIQKRIELMMKGRREGPTARLQKFLEETVGHKVVEVKLGRKPIVGAVKAALNLLSLGKFSKAAHQLGYDDVFHQYLLVKLDNGKSYKIEKNEVIVQMDAQPDDYKNKIWDIKIPDGKDLTLRDMFENAAKGKGSDFWIYNGSSANCQIFSRSLLEDNGLLPDDPSDFTTQDSKTLMDTLPPMARKIADGLVDIAAGGDRFLNGDGLHKKNKLMRGGSEWRFNTQTPEKMAQLQEKYKGQAHPSFIDQYADILSGHVKMSGWRGKVPSSEWHPDEKAAYLRDGSPISSREVINLAGKTWNNFDELKRIRSVGQGLFLKPANIRPRALIKK